MPENLITITYELSNDDRVVIAREMGLESIPHKNYCAYWMIATIQDKLSELHRLAQGESK